MRTANAETPVGYGKWQNVSPLPEEAYTCGHCGDRVSSRAGYYARARKDGSGDIVATIRICPDCQGPTIFTSEGSRLPLATPGRRIENVPGSLAKLYEEARASAANGTHAAAVLVCRKILMNVAVGQGMTPGGSFGDCVRYLAANGLLRASSKPLVDRLVERCDRASHEIVAMSEEDSAAALAITEATLLLLYEFPSATHLKTSSA